MPHQSRPSPSTVGRARHPTRPVPAAQPSAYDDGRVHLECGDSLQAYARWPAPTVIVSDGAYGVLGFEGDTAGHRDIPRLV